MAAILLTLGLGLNAFGIILGVTLLPVSRLPNSLKTFLATACCLAPPALCSAAAVTPTCDPDLVGAAWGCAIITAFIGIPAFFLCKWRL